MNSHNHHHNPNKRTYEQTLRSFTDQELITEERILYRICSNEEVKPEDRLKIAMVREEQKRRELSFPLLQTVQKNYASIMGGCDS